MENANMVDETRFNDFRDEIFRTINSNHGIVMNLLTELSKDVKGYAVMISDHNKDIALQQLKIEQLDKDYNELKKQYHTLENDHEKIQIAINTIETKTNDKIQSSNKSIKIIVAIISSMAAIISLLSLILNITGVI